jgi:flagellar basal body rod protein FlgC
MYAMDILSIAQAGMARAQDSFEISAQNVARASLPQTQPATQDSLSLTDQAVSMLQAKGDFAANVKVAQVADDLTKATLSLLA